MYANRLLRLQRHSRLDPLHVFPGVRIVTSQMKYWSGEFLRAAAPGCHRAHSAVILLPGMESRRTRTSLPSGAAAPASRSSNVGARLPAHSCR